MNSYANIFNDGAVFTASTTWVRHDIYQYEEKVSRWMLLKWLIRGTMRMRWRVPYNQKDKRYHLKGKLLNLGV